ncbi:uncharacterized protein HHUB_4128 (plasmid) [Halobacterium hubeiense]|uniref:Uncharacterized protein n=1 Tax=Halobacterium hubeiense TaxID=1407499 RepID=A0A0U5D1N9_9EURY|nr:hypothetical protein [Halobacterium hubeiense]CQH63583.1 uncharacterized protein HHUB_4128 [Halobacterium hubeiense]
MVASPIVLNTGVLSSFLLAGWFENLNISRIEASATNTSITVSGVPDEPVKD